MGKAPKAPAAGLARRRAALAVLLLALAGSPVVSGEANRPSWGPPLENYQGLAATFGEYRPTHLHAGVDLSTGGRNGLPVKAVADGAIYRVRDTHRGFGRALFIRHAGGYLSLYAHLSAFTDKGGLEKMVRDRTGGFGRHAGDIVLEKPIPVEKGEVVAFSGESGEGLPHLHLEIRDGENRPVNPISVGLVFPDRDPPVLEELVTAPPPLDAALDGRDWSHVAKLRPAGLPPGEPLRGRVNFLLRGYDRAGAESRLGLYELEVKLDGEPFFAERFDRFSYDDWHRVGTVMDPLGSHLSPTIYEYHLFRHPGNNLGLVTFASESAEGALDTALLAPGDHRLEITARDASGNRTDVFHRFTVAPRPAAGTLPAPAKGNLAAPAGTVWVPARQGGKAAWDGLELAFPAGALYEDALVRREKIATGEDPFLPRVSAPWTVRCTSYPFEKQATVSLKADGSFRDSRRVGVYARDRIRGQWLFIGAEPGSSPGWFSANIRNPGTFALLEDTLPPSIGKASLAGRLALVPLEDRGTGIDETSLAAALDRKPVPLEHDPDRRRVEVEIPPGLAAGAHRLVLEASDRAGNTSRAETGIVIP